MRLIPVLMEASRAFQAMPLPYGVWEFTVPAVLGNTVLMGLGDKCPKHKVWHGKEAPCPACEAGDAY